MGLQVAIPWCLSNLLMTTHPSESSLRWAVFEMMVVTMITLMITIIVLRISRKAVLTAERSRLKANATMTGEFRSLPRRRPTDTDDDHTIATATTQTTASLYGPSSSIMSENVRNDPIPSLGHELRSAGNSAGAADCIRKDVDETSRRRSIELQNGSILLPIGKNNLLPTRKVSSNRTCQTVVVTRLTDKSVPARMIGHDPRPPSPSFHSHERWYLGKFGMDSPATVLSLYRPPLTIYFVNPNRPATP